MEEEHGMDLGEFAVREILDLPADQLSKLHKRLTHHALCKMRRLTWRGASVVRGGAVPGGHEPTDFATDAIVKAVDGVRKWNRQQFETLESFLRSIIDSDINHLADSIDNARGRRLSAPTGGKETEHAYETPGTEPNPLRVVIDREAHDLFIAAAMKELEGDKFLTDLLKCFDMEVTQPTEIAELLDVTVENVNNGKKRLRRVLDQIFSRTLAKKRAKP